MAITQFLINLGLNGVAGAGVGYGTNNLAIRMLFQKYPLIGGEGIMEKREELLDSLSNLVEEKLITPERIIQELESPALVEAVIALQDHLVQVTLKEKLKQFDYENIKDLPGFESSLNNIFNYLSDNQEEFLEPLLDLWLKDLELEKIVPMKALEKPIDKIFGKLISSFSKEISPLLEAIYETFKDKKINNFFNSEIINQLSQEVLPSNQDEAAALFKKLTAEISPSVFEILNLSDLIPQFCQNLKEKKIIDFLGLNTSQPLMKSLSNRLSQYLASEEGEQFLESIVLALVSIINDLTDSKTHLYDFFSVDFERKLRSFLNKNALTLTEKVNMWLKDNNTELSNSFNNWVEEYLKSHSNYSVLKNILLKIVQFFFGNLSENIVGYLDDQIIRLEKEGADYLMDEMIIPYLKTTTVGDLVLYLKPKIEALGLDRLLKRQLTNYSRKLTTWLAGQDINLIFPQWQTFTLGELFTSINFDLNAWLSEKIEELPKTMIEYWLKKPANWKQAQTFLKDQGQNLGRMTLKDMINGLGSLEKPLLSYLEKSETKEIFKTWLLNMLGQFGNKGEIGKFLKKDKNLKKSLVKNLGNPILNNFKVFQEEIGNKKSRKLYQEVISLHNHLAKEHDFAQTTSKKILGTLTAFIRQKNWLKGGVKRSVKTNLEGMVNQALIPLSFYTIFKEEFKINPELDRVLKEKIIDKPFKDAEAMEKELSQIKDLNESGKAKFLTEANESGKKKLISELDNFMGKELAPINNLGALLGAISGLILTLIPIPVFWSLISAPVVYAGTGIATNWLAIKMLFNIKFMGIKYQGVIVSDKNKSRLAKSMGDFIDEQLLTKETLSKILSEHELTLEKHIKEKISANNYSFLTDLIENYSDDFFKIIGPQIFNLMEKGSEKIPEALKPKILEIFSAPIPKSILDDVSSKLLSDYQSHEKWLLAMMSNSFKTYKETDTLLADIIPEGLKTFIEEKISELLGDRLEQIKGYLNQAKLLDDWSENLDKIFKPYENKAFNELIPESTQKAWITRTQKWLTKKLYEEEFKNYILELAQKHILIPEIDPAKKLKTLFNGHLFESFKNSPRNLFDYYSKEIINISAQEKTREYLVKQILEKVTGAGFFEKDIRGFLKFVASEKLESFINSKRKDFIYLIDNFLMTDLAEKKLSDLGLSEQSFNFQRLEQLISDKLQKSSALENIIEKLTKALINEVLLKGLNPKAILEILSFTSVSDIIGEFEPELKKLQSNLNKVIIRNEDEINGLLLKMGSDYMAKAIYSKPLSTLLKSLSQDEINSSFEKISTKVFASESIKDSIEDYLHSFKHELSKTKLKDIFQEDEVINVIDNFVKTLPIETPEQKEALLAAIKKPIINLLEESNNLIPPEAKDFLLDWFLISFLETLKENTYKVMESLQVNAIVKEQVNLMEPEAIESTFDFAKPVFNKLIWYGWLGGIAGVVTAPLLYLISVFIG